MSKRPWWKVTYSRRSALVGSVLWFAVALLQAISLIGQDVPWWRWLLALFILALAAYYFAAWRAWSRHARQG